MKRVQRFEKNERLRARITAIVMILALGLCWLPIWTPIQAQTVKNVQQPLASAARTTSGNSAWFDIGDADQLRGYLTVTATTGGTLDVKYQESVDGGTTAFDIDGASFSQVSSGSSSQTINATSLFGKKVRVAYTIGGGGGFTFHVEFMAYRGTPVIVSSTDANAANLTSGTIPLARISGLTNTEVSNSAAIAYSKLALTGSVVNADVSTSAAIAASKLAEDAIRTTSVNLSAANIIAMGTTPVELIAAPAAGKMILVESLTFKMVRTSTAFTGGGAVEFRYTNGSGAKVTADIAATVVTTGGAGTEYNHVGGVIASFTPVAAANIVITNATAPFADGTGTAVVTLKYRVITP